MEICLFLNFVHVKETRPNGTISRTADTVSSGFETYVNERNLNTYISAIRGTTGYTSVEINSSM